MAYNNGFPATYPQYYPQYSNPYPMQQAQQNQTSSIIWVQGEAGAKSYMVAPGNTVQLWDSESQTIYLKSADASGMPSIKVLDYTIRDTQNSITAQNKPTESDLYATKEELRAMQKSLEKRLKSALKGLGGEEGDE